MILQKSLQIFGIDAVQVFSLDICKSKCIEKMCAELLKVGAQEREKYLRNLFTRIQPNKNEKRSVICIRWVRTVIILLIRFRDHSG